MAKSESIKEITTALAKAQIAFLPILRTAEVDYPTTTGRKKYNYAPLSEVIEATKKALSDNGLVVTQTTKLIEGNNILETLLSHISGEWLSGELYIGKQDQPPQSEGSSLTYKRRYGMSAILNVSSEEDDDAEGAKSKEEKPKGASSITEPKKIIAQANEDIEKLWPDGKPAPSSVGNEAEIASTTKEVAEHSEEEKKASIVKSIEGITADQFATLAELLGQADNKVIIKAKIKEYGWSATTIRELTATQATKLIFELRPLTWEKLPRVPAPTMNKGEEDDTAK